MKLPPKYPKDLHPLTTDELGELWKSAPSLEMRAALWEIKRLKFFFQRCQTHLKEIDYLYFPHDKGALSGVRGELYEEVAEKWPPQEPAPPRKVPFAEAQENLRRKLSSKDPHKHVVKVQRPKK